MIITFNCSIRNKRNGLSINVKLRLLLLRTCRIKQGFPSDNSFYLQID